MTRWRGTVLVTCDGREFGRSKRRLRWVAQWAGGGRDQSLSSAPRMRGSSREERQGCSLHKTRLEDAGNKMKQVQETVIAIDDSR